MGLYLNNYTDSTWSTTEEDCVRVIGGEIIVVMHQSVVSQPVVLAGNVLCILLMLVSVQYVFHDNQDSVY